MPSYEFVGSGLNLGPSSQRAAYVTVQPPFQTGWYMDAWGDLGKVTYNNPGVTSALSLRVMNSYSPQAQRANATVMSTKATHSYSHWPPTLPWLHYPREITTKRPTKVWHLLKRGNIPNCESLDSCSHNKCRFRDGPVSSQQRPRAPQVQCGAATADWVHSQDSFLLCHHQKIRLIRVKTSNHSCYTERYDSD